MDERTPGLWVLLSYRMPREPSTPRIAVWRRLKQLGVVQISDGLVALPADAWTREQLEWVADEAVEAGGMGAIWLARPGGRALERDLVARMAAARSAEYAAVAQEAVRAAELVARGETPSAGQVRRLRRELRRIRRRDFFPPPERDTAEGAVRTLASAVAETSVARSGPGGKHPGTPKPEVTS